MAVDCSDPGALANAARCFEHCIPGGMQISVQSYLLAVIANSLAGTSLDPQALVTAASAAGFMKLGGMDMAVQDYLLCQIANASGA